MSEWIIEAESLEEIPDGNWTIGRKLVRCEDCSRRCICYHSADYYCADGEKVTE